MQGNCYKVRNPLILIVIRGNIINNKLRLVDFIYLALRDPHVKDEESLIEITYQYGKRFGVKPEEVEKELKEINKFLITSGCKGLLA